MQNKVVSLLNLTKKYHTKEGEIDAIKEISDNLINSAQKVKESMESITQDYIDGLDRQKDKF